VNFTVPGLGSANPNKSAAGNIVGTGDFGKLTHAADPRILQFALSSSFDMAERVKLQFRGAARRPLYLRSFRQSAAAHELALA